MFTVKVKVSSPRPSGTRAVSFHFPDMVGHCAIVRGSVSAHVVRGAFGGSDFDLVEWSRCITGDHVRQVTGAVVVTRSLVDSGKFCDAWQDNKPVSFSVLAFTSGDVDSLAEDMRRESLEYVAEIAGDDHVA